jgi:hypothetical protein
MKNPLRVHSKENITNILYTCAILHNVLLHYDGFDKLWTEDDWLSSDPVDSDDEDSDNTGKKRFMIRPDRLQEYHLPLPESDVPTQVESGHFQLKQQLIANLRHQWDRGDVEHLRYPKRN